MLQARGITCILDGRQRLQNVDVDVPPGQIVALLGPNGAGKSTLLRVLSGELEPDAGSATLNGHALRKWSATDLARTRAVLTQSESLRFPFLVEDVIALGRHPWGAEPGIDSERRIVTAAMQAAGIANLHSRLYTHLSGGERAKVQFARILAQIWEPLPGAPRYLLLDEPTASLDLAGQHELLSMTRCFAAGDCGVVVVLHDPNLAMLYADQVLLLKDGTTVAQGPTQVALEPQNIRKAFDIEVDLIQRDGVGRPWIAARGRSTPRMKAEAWENNGRYPDSSTLN